MSWGATNWDLDFDEPIAERTLDGDRGQQVTVKFGAPRADQEGHWACPYKIEGLPDEPNYSMYGAGVDGVQAIIAALANVGAYLNYRWKAELGLSFYDADFLGFLDATLPPLKSGGGADTDQPT